mmetsp:Transcript_16215/g.48575  ORF Transcript_16215/g.48575 Transcript_16215/m.48575 type:complete len:243 (+) Transcript_16215:2550-3278(+)
MEQQVCSWIGPGGEECCPVEANPDPVCPLPVLLASIKARRWLLRWWSPGQLWICCGRRSCGLRLSLHCHSLCSRRPVLPSIHGRLGKPPPSWREHSRDSTGSVSTAQPSCWAQMTGTVQCPANTTSQRAGNSIRTAAVVWMFPASWQLLQLRMRTAWRCIGREQCRLVTRRWLRLCGATSALPSVAQGLHLRRRPQRSQQLACLAHSSCLQHCSGRGATCHSVPTGWHWRQQVTWRWSWKLC